jgi:cytochrome c-type biogenesis protein CcsB
MKVFNFLFSGLFMGILLVFFATAAGYATFIENDFGAVTAKALVYNAWWFELLMALMTVNFTGMIFTRQLYRKSKINILLIHLALIFILLGAAVTRYLGFEGTMHIRHQQTNNLFLSSDTYLDLKMRAGEQEQGRAKKVWLSPLERHFFRYRGSIGGKEVEVKALRYLPNMTRAIVPDPEGGVILSLVVAGAQGRRDYFLAEGDRVLAGDLPFSFGDTSVREHVQFLYRSDSLFLRAPSIVQDLGHQGQEALTLDAGLWHPVQPMKLYNIGQLRFVIREVQPRAALSYMQQTDPSGESVGIADVRLRVGEHERIVRVPADPGGASGGEQFTLDGIDFSISLGPRWWQLPFALKLNEFQLERYPGSNSPSSFASEVTLIDPQRNIERPYRIFMNNILEYGGYRFYQSSYDQDEQGTILSVNRDYWGTLITYIGYFLLIASLIASLFTRKTRFAALARKVREVHAARRNLVAGLVLLCAPFIAGAQSPPPAGATVSAEHAASFGRLLVQSVDGRIVPANTLAHNILLKMHRKDKLGELTADRVLLSMSAHPEAWFEVPLIKVSDEDLKKQLGITGSRAAFSDFFEQGRYKLQEQVQEVYARPPGSRSRFDKDLVAVDERVNICLMVFNGNLLRIFPLPEHPEQKWITGTELLRYGQSIDSTLTANPLDAYFGALRGAMGSGDYTAADEALNSIFRYQFEHGGELIPSAMLLDLEILYHNINPFDRLYPWYMLLGFGLLVIFLIGLFRPGLQFNRTVRVFYTLLWLAFLLHTLGLGVRWYISGHAPWSNGYESMIYIGWATMLAGFLFYRQSPMTLPVTAILAGIVLFTAHLSWMDPQITNLVPVLKSYWLTIHVSTITASYGFFGLAAMMALLNLCIMIFRTRKNHMRINLAAVELTLIIEMAMMSGLILLVMGNFLGGVWANESWGRYWGWDPKETWSLVTIIVYSFILHMRLIPGMRNLLSVNILSMFAFGSVLMTYFGVNYYLSGLHSYAQGDPVPVPNGLYYTIAILVAISLLAAFNDRRIGALKTEQVELEE